MSSGGEWCLIESDPGVFTELIKGFGVTGLQVEEIYSLEKSLLDELRPVHGLILLYKWQPGEKPLGSIVQDSRLRDIFFAKQVITNACATQAIISVLLNVDHCDIELGTVLSEFKEFSTALDPATRGLALSNSEVIRNVHNGFSRQQMFEFDKEFSKKDDAFHFVAYLPINGRLYELDGLKEGPVDLGKCDSEDWYSSIEPLLNQRIQSYASDEIHFNLMAIVSDLRLSYEKEIARVQSELEKATTRLEELAGQGEEAEQLQKEVLLCSARLEELAAKVAIEKEKFSKYKLENIRRKHNYLPLIFEVLKLLAKNGQLVELCEKVQKKNMATSKQ